VSLITFKTERYSLITDVTLSYAMLQGHKQRMYEYSVLRGIFGAKMDEKTGRWRKLNKND
jgi:hypothetical protein